MFISFVRKFKKNQTKILKNQKNCFCCLFYFLYICYVCRFNYFFILNYVLSLVDGRANLLYYFDINIMFGFWTLELLYLHILISCFFLKMIESPFIYIIPL